VQRKVGEGVVAVEQEFTGSSSLFRRWAVPDQAETDVEQEFTGSSSLFRALAWAGVLVPGVDFRAVREVISMAEVLELIGFMSQVTLSGAMRGPCPIHRSHSAKSRSFAVNVQRKVYRCFTCGSAGNHLDLYGAFTRQGIYQAAIDLCEKLRRDVPWIQPKRPKQIKPVPVS
jgi:CHC2-type zinc finger protein